VPTQWGAIVEISFNQITQACRTLVFVVQINEQFLKSLNMRICIRVNHALLDMARDERHDVTALHECRSTPAENGLGFIAFEERFLRPIGSVVIRRVGRGV